MWLVLSGVVDSDLTSWSEESQEICADEDISSSFSHGHVGSNKADRVQLAIYLSTTVFKDGLRLTCRIRIGKIDYHTGALSAASTCAADPLSKIFCHTFPEFTVSGSLRTRRRRENSKQGHYERIDQ
jgi:hypothetical protein